MQRKHQALIFSGALHIVVLTLLAVSLTQTQHQAMPTPQMEPVVKAVAVNEEQVLKELERIKSEREQQKASEQQRKQEAEEQVRKAEAKRKAEEARLERVRKEAAQQKQREAEAKRKAEAAEKARLAKLKAEQEAERKRLAEIKAEQQRIEREREAERQRLAELERQRKLEEQRREQERLERERQAREEQLRQQLAEEAKRLQAERRRELATYLAEYQALIRDKVQRNWSPPPGTSRDFDCRILVHQIPGGSVVSVRILDSCGNDALDRSVENAVQKASPLPSPPDPEVFDREIEFMFTPDTL